MDVIAGFTTESITHILGGTYRGGWRPLNDGIIAGRIRGVAGVVGCDSPKQIQDQGHLDLVYELLRQDVLVVQTGCSAIACGKAGLLQPEAAFRYAGRGLQEICEATGIPPVLHTGSCVDNSRILPAAAITGAYKYARAGEAKPAPTMEATAGGHRRGLPNTAVYLPLILALTG